MTASGIQGRGFAGPVGSFWGRMPENGGLKGRRRGSARVSELADGEELVSFG